jgi:hypothetical protein
MKKTRLRIILYALVIVHLFAGCKKDWQESPSTTPVVINTNSSVSGRVLDESRQPIASAKVIVGSSVTVTDEKGNFTLDNFSSGRTADVFVRVEKPGFFITGRLISVFSGSHDYVVVQMARKALVAGFRNSDGSTVVTDNGYIVFTPSSLGEPASNKVYTGGVTVAVSVLDPTLPNFPDMVPGALIGLDTSNTVRGLQSFGMLSVELIGANGEPLQLLPGQRAKITMKIPDALLGSAPTSIPLWHFNDSTGFWIQEGTAQRQGNSYVGDVKHFSTWNCDVSFPIIRIQGNLVTGSGLPLGNRRIVIDSKSTGVISGFAYTNKKGFFSAVVPYNTEVQLNAFNDCGIKVSSSGIGPLTASKDLGKIEVFNSTEPVLSIKGTATECSGQPLRKGFATINLDGQTYKSEITEGILSLKVPRCRVGTTEVTISVLDALSNRQSIPKKVAVTDTSVSVGLLQTCLSVDSFVTYTTTSGLIRYYSDSMMYSRGTYATGYSIGGATRMANGESSDYLSFTIYPYTPYNSPPIGPPVRWDNASGYFAPGPPLFTFYMGGEKKVTITEFGAKGSYIGGFATLALYRHLSATSGVPVWAESANVKFRFLRRD